MKIFLSFTLSKYGSSKSLQSNFFDSEINPFFSNSSLLPKTPIRGAFKLEKAFKDFGRVMSPVCMIRERFILLKI